MAQTYTTREGDALDLICLREYGIQAGAVEQVLESNPHIKMDAHRLPAGLTLILPNIDAAKLQSGAVRLWD